MFRHFGGEGVLANPNTNGIPGSRGPQARDVGEQWGILYLKYNNGRFFVNMEYDYDRVTERRSGELPLTAISRNQAFPTLDTQHDSGAVEMGALCGPAKASVIGAWFTGDDYRYTQHYAGLVPPGGVYRIMFKAGKQQDTWSNVTVFRPYSYLMIYGYGLGTSFARDTGEGFVQDAAVYAARLDYAAAASLERCTQFCMGRENVKEWRHLGLSCPQSWASWRAIFSGSVVYVKGSNSIRQKACVPDNSRYVPGLGN